MTNTAQALYDFFNSFGIPAYVEETVPDEAVLPYITYDLLRPERLEQSSLHARIWYRSTSFIGITAKADEIKQELESGYSVLVSDGALRIWPDNNFIQFQRSDEPELKIAYLSMIIESDYN